MVTYVARDLKIIADRVLKKAKEICASKSVPFYIAYEFSLQQSYKLGLCQLPSIQKVFVRLQLI